MFFRILGTFTGLASLFFATWVYFDPANLTDNELTTAQNEQVPAPIDKTVITPEPIATDNAIVQNEVIPAQQQIPAPVDKTVITPEPIATDNAIVQNEVIPAQQQIPTPVDKMVITPAPMATDNAIVQNEVAPVQQQIPAPVDKTVITPEPIATDNAIVQNEVIPAQQQIPAPVDKIVITPKPMATNNAIVQNEVVPAQQQIPAPIDKMVITPEPMATDNAIVQNEVVPAQQQIPAPVNVLSNQGRVISESTLHLNPNQNINITVSPLNPIRKAIWPPFNQQQSADAFAQKVLRLSHIEILVEPFEENNAIYYQLILEAVNPEIFQQQLAIIQQTTGLNFKPQ